MSSAGRSRPPEGAITHAVDRTSGPSEFAERLLTVLAEGAFTSTYKYAVILGLVDLCVEYSTRTGGAPTSVTTRQLAERILELYWPQVRTFDERTLRQNSGNQAAILTRILRFQNQVGAPRISAARARHLAPYKFGPLGARCRMDSCRDAASKASASGLGAGAFSLSASTGAMMSDVQHSRFA